MYKVSSYDYIGLIAPRRVSEGVYRTNFGDANDLIDALHLTKLVPYLIPGTSFAGAAYVQVEQSTICRRGQIQGQLTFRQKRSQIEDAPTDSLRRFSTGSPRRCTRGSITPLGNDVVPELK
jgi:hypothetical protein